MTSNRRRTADVVIRLAKSEDARGIARLYAPYVSETAINFEYIAPAPDEFQKRILDIGDKFPFLVATDNRGEILGYAFAEARGSRPAWRYTVNTSIYLDKEQRGRGIGKRLYAVLEAILKSQGIVQVLACITVNSADSLSDLAFTPVPYQQNESQRCKELDVHLPRTSPLFHAAMGYVPVGREPCVGYKFGRWYDKLWMQKQIVPLSNDPEEIQYIADLDIAQVTALLRNAINPLPNYLG